MILNLSELNYACYLQVKLWFSYPDDRTILGGDRKNGLLSFEYW